MIDPNSKTPKSNDPRPSEQSANEVSADNQSMPDQNMPNDLNVANDPSKKGSGVGSTQTIVVKPADSRIPTQDSQDSIENSSIEDSIDNGPSTQDASISKAELSRSEIGDSEIGSAEIDDSENVDMNVTKEANTEKTKHSEKNPDTNKEVETEVVPPTDLSLVCSEPVDDNKQALEKTGKKTSTKWGYQLLLVLVLMGAFVAVMGYQTLFGELNRPQGELTVDEGQSYYGLLPEFQREVPMFSATLAKAYIKYQIDAPLNAGVYDMPANPNLQEFLQALQQEQKIDVVAVQVIEGKTAKDLYTAIATTPDLTLEVLQPDGTPKPNFKQALGIDATTPDGKYTDNLEGWFTPDTYHYAKGATDKQILTDLYNSQRQALDTAWDNRAEGLPYETPYEALIMASIIEKETSVPSERALVSAVFVNRLKKGMRLQTDPTIIYGMGERYDGDIRRRDINEKTDYNTYQIDGLPPTPIALPSHASIEAAMHPAEDDALYFVATGAGGHKFSKTLAEHNKAVQDYLKVIRAKPVATNSDEITSDETTNSNESISNSE